MTKTVLIYSGGLDSTTLLFDLIDQGHEIKCLIFDYGQRHSKEILYAMSMCDSNCIPYQIVDMPEMAQILSGSSQTSKDMEVPEGHYADENMKTTVVPNRNMIMLSIAAGHAISLKFDRVAYAAHSGDHAIYPDCRPEFTIAMQEVFQLCDWHKVTLYTPYISLSKGSIIHRGLKLGVPYEKTWTCYKGESLACGVCGSCVERQEAFEENNIKDPLTYRGDNND